MAPVVPLSTSRRVLYRLRTDFPLAILTLFGAVATFGILPFAIYRFQTGSIFHGVVDLLVVVFIVAAVAYAWRTARAAAAGAFVAITSTLGCMAIAVVVGSAALPWMYVALLANYVLLSPRVALSVAALALTILTLQGKAFDTPVQMSVFLVTASVISLFAHIFFSRMREQRLQLEVLASHDSLTGAYNRRAMESELEVAVEQQRRERRPFGLLVLDLDHFKRVNDSHGHEVGDVALVEFTALVRANSRRVDRLFRYGGEEFVLLLPGADARALATVAEQLRSKVADRLHVKDAPLTVSIGAAELRPGEDWRSWLARADAALYRAKHGGRNRTEVDQDGDGVAWPPLAGEVQAPAT